MLLVVVLTMIVALTVGLSLASRTITNMKISKQNEESQRAFQAAEAGIERALESAIGSSLEFGNNSKFTTTITNPQGSSFLLNAGETVEQDVGLDVWLSEYPNYANPVTGTIYVYWSTTNQGCGRTDDNVAAALSIVTLSGNLSNPTVTREVYDPCTRIPNGSLFDSRGGSVDGTSFNYATSIPVLDGIIMRVIPVYNSTKIGVTSSVALPKQGTVVESVGESGETVRRVQYFSSNPQVPLEIFPYSILSQ